MKKLIIFISALLCTRVMAFTQIAGIDTDQQAIWNLTLNERTLI